MQYHDSIFEFASYHPEASSFCSCSPNILALCHIPFPGMYWLSSQAIHRPLGQLAATMWLDGSSPCYFFAANQTNGFSVACTSGYVFESFLAQNYSLYKSSLNVDQANKHMTSQKQRKITSVTTCVLLP